MMSEEIDKLERMVSTKKLADILDVTEQTIYNYGRQGMPRHKLGYNTVKYDVVEVLEWLKRRV